MPLNRAYNQQLCDPQFENPAQVVGWMGAMQAQDLRMVKWAIGMRTKKPSLSAVDKAIADGDILRTHVLRPTWHYARREDLRWMLMLTGKSVWTGTCSWGRDRGFTPEIYHRHITTIGEALSGGKSMTRQEVSELLTRRQKDFNPDLASHILMGMEANAIVCSGPERDGSHTYALLDERAPSTSLPTYEEALARLATLYFRSHSPASLPDFTWWSGLGIGAAKKAVASIADDLETLKKNLKEPLYIHKDSQAGRRSRNTLHFLPPWDEYLISYKDRSGVLDPVNYHFAFNNYGIFQPVILYRGRIVGNWKYKKPATSTSKKAVPKPCSPAKSTLSAFQTSFFCPHRPAETETEALLEKAALAYTRFLSR